MSLSVILKDFTIIRQRRVNCVTLCVYSALVLLIRAQTAEVYNSLIIMRALVKVTAHKDSLQTSLLTNVKSASISVKLAITQSRRAPAAIRVVRSLTSSRKNVGSSAWRKSACKSVTNVSSATTHVLLAKVHQTLVLRVRNI